MKKISILTFLILISNLTFSQTKSETESWIKSFISTYSNATITFQNGILTHENPFDPIGLHMKGSVSIKELSSVQISGGTKGHTAIYLSCYQGDCVDDGFKSTDESFQSFKNNKLSIQMNSEISEELQKRIEKAFNHLIKLYGGKVLDNTF